MSGADPKKSAGLRLGARVQMSPLGREQYPKYGDREGLIVGRRSPSSWRVKLDERTTIQAIHEVYLRLAPKPAAARRDTASPAVSRRNASSVH
jgi:hypothetical protein